MTETEFNELEQNLKKGKTARIKKETLLDYIADLKKKHKTREKELQDQVDEEKFYNDITRDIEKHIDESTMFIKELRELNIDLTSENTKLKEDITKAKNSIIKRNWIIAGIIVITTLTLILI